MNIDSLGATILMHKHAVLSLHSTYMSIALFACYDLFTKLLLQLNYYVVGSSVCARLYVCA